MYIPVYSVLSEFMERLLNSFFIIRQPPALPCRLQHSTIGLLGLNHRVRDGYGCFPQRIATGNGLKWTRTTDLTLIRRAL